MLFQKPGDAGRPKHPSECIRCGRCCRKGGPSLHHIDRELVEKGVIHARFLYTIRRGEPAYDNVLRRLQPAGSDIIKIKGKDGAWTCRFFDEKANACRIYKNRPLECRALKCWDTEEIERVYAKNRLTRRDLISEAKGLWDLVEDHQRRCDYEIIRRLATALPRQKKARCTLTEIIRYDMELRKLVVSKGGLDEEMLDFLFGRPLHKTIENFGLKPGLKAPR